VKFFSKAAQDQFVFENFFRGKRNGVFVDVGAYDGEKFSNSLFFERSLAWHGLCVEPLASAYSALVARRKCISEQICVADFEGQAGFVESNADGDEKMLSGLAGKFDPRHAERMRLASSGSVERLVAVTKLSSLLEKHALFHVDYCSIDAAGAEFSILSELDLNRFDISLFTIDSTYNHERLGRLMADKGYEAVAKLEQDLVFKRRGVKRLAHTSVICAVWHGDPQREQLLAGHAANLSAQTVRIESVYVFDGRDVPPESIPGRKIVVHEDLSIYQAWNVGLALVDTPFVMNLNLDDRLAPDAVERLEAALLEQGAALAGGDWKVCYSQDSTDAVEACYPAERLPFIADWPPRFGTRTRIGSGTGERGTFGPATIWRMDAHIGAPRYPWRLPDGTTLKIAGDAGWWLLVMNHLKKKTVRLPQIIGNYHSRPESQAEFRAPQDETKLLDQLGISLL
jgi:FkbM family methyltransferase